MSLLRGRANTTLNTPPAPVPSPELEEAAERNKVMLDHYVTKAERTVAASQQMFATQAAEGLRRY